MKPPVLHVAIRTDASATIGTGHLRRCLSLAEAMLDLGCVRITLLTRRLDEVASRVLEGEENLMVRWLDAPDGQATIETDGTPPHHFWAGVPWRQDADETVEILRDNAVDWLIIDHYAFDARWHEAVREGLNCRMLVVDDLADRPLGPDLLVDPNWDPDHAGKYAGRLVRESALLGGTRLALLSRGYRDARRHEFRDTVSSIGIFMGGTDPGNVSATVLRACREVAGFKGTIEIAATRANPNLSALRAACDRWPDTRLLVDQRDLSEFFARHDIQVGAGGGATWERCCIGAPSILLAFAANQASIVRQLGELGVVLPVANLDPQDIGTAVHSLIEDPATRASMADRCRALVDGWGCVRVALWLTRSRLTLRAAKPEDAVRVFPWRNAEVTRQYFRNPEPIDLDSHRQWWSDSLRSPARHLLMAAVGHQDVGVIRFDTDETDAEVSLYVAPELTGLGLGVAMLETGRQWVAENLPAVRTLSANVSPKNRRSARAFGVAGYTRIDPDRWQLEVRE